MILELWLAEHSILRLSEEHRSFLKLLVAFYQVFVKLVIALPPGRTVDQDLVLLWVLVQLGRGLLVFFCEGKLSLVENRLRRAQPPSGRGHKVFEFVVYTLYRSNNRLTAVSSKGCVCHIVGVH